MAIHFGNDKIKEIYVGSDKIKEVYHGSDLVWKMDSGITQDGYWIHKDTGVKTYFGLGDSSIEDGIMSSPSWRYKCSEVKIPSGVTGLGRDCFRINKALTSITLPESLTNIGRDCFRGCEALTSITLPDSVTSMESYCFASCTSLTSITLPEGVVSLGEGCFSGCSYLTLATVLPATPPSLGWAAFNNVHASLSIKVPSSSVNAYKTATNWTAYADKISAI